MGLSAVRLSTSMCFGPAAMHRPALSEPSGHQPNPQQLLDLVLQQQQSTARMSRLDQNVLLACRGLVVADRGKPRSPESPDAWEGTLEAHLAAQAGDLGAFQEGHGQHALRDQAWNAAWHLHLFPHPLHPKCIEHSGRPRPASPESIQQGAAQPNVPDRAVSCLPAAMPQAAAAIPCRVVQIRPCCIDATSTATPCIPSIHCHPIRSQSTTAG